MEIGGEEIDQKRAKKIEMENRRENMRKLEKLV